MYHLHKTVTTNPSFSLNIYGTISIATQKVIRIWKFDLKVNRNKDIDITFSAHCALC